MHISLELGVVISGRMHRDHGAGWFHVGPGQAWAAASLQPHYWRIGRAGVSVLFFHFSPALLGQMPVLDGFDLTIPFRSPARFSAIGSTRGFRRSLARLAGQLAPTHRKLPSPGQGLFDFLHVAWLVSREAAGTTAETPPPPAGVLGAPPIAPAIDLLTRSAGRRIRVAEAAQACHMARRTFCRYFQAAMGIGFAEFALRSRLALAARDLRHTSLPMKLIADRFGFTDASHFHHAFAAHYGITPARYRGSTPTSLPLLDPAVAAIAP